MAGTDYHGVVVIFTPHLFLCLVKHRATSEPDDSEVMVDLVRSRLRLYEFRLSNHERGFPKSQRTTYTENLEHLRPVFHRLSYS